MQVFPMWSVVDKFSHVELADGASDLLVGTVRDWCTVEGGTSAFKELMNRLNED